MGHDPFVLPPWSVVRRALTPAGRGLLIASLVLLVPSPGAVGAATVHCVGYGACSANGYSDAGYGSANARSYWNMVTGHNCTNYAAYRVIQAGGPGSRPWSGSGDAHRWGHELPGITDQTPAVQSIAWWDSNQGGWGKNGHVAYVEQVVSADMIRVSEDIFDGDFRWRTISRGEAAWPTGFIHLADARVSRIGALPRIAGKLRVGERVRVGAGSWSPSGVSVGYQWLADGRTVRGATQSSLELTPRFLGKRLTVKLSARRLGYVPASATTAASDRVRRGRIRVDGAPRVRGRAVVAERLTADLGRTTPQTRASYRWLADGTKIRGARMDSLRLAPELARARISVRVTVKRRGYASRTLRSGRTEPVKRATFHQVAPPRVSGTVQVGETVHAVPTQWSVKPSRRVYVWLVDKEVVEGNYTARLPLVAAYEGKELHVVEGATRRGYEQGVAVSASGGLVAAADERPEPVS